MKVGQKVQLLAEFSGVPAGTVGKVVEVEAGGSLYLVEWMLPGRDARQAIRHLLTAEEVQKLVRPL
ncbi:MAG: hypothetical protein QHH05_00170 [Syntrophomonadaceae bacterium]|jgi:hypothetical protein|nr:hypothetical protein [Syntrophomonadaceae bacterium]MDH7496852.1 hypothetical protein [Syntrophomonadaceae bacterium]